MYVCVICALSIPLPVRLLRGHLQDLCLDVRLLHHRLQVSWLGAGTCVFQKTLWDGTKLIYWNIIKFLGAILGSHPAALADLAGPYRTRRTMTASTIIMPDSQGGINEDLLEAQSCSGSLSDYMSSSPASVDKEASLIKWIEVRGPNVPPHDANGFERDTSMIWNLIREKAQVTEDMQKLRAECQNQAEKLEKVKQIQISRFGVDHPKMAELDAWAQGKIDETNNRALKLQSQCEANEKNMMGHVKALAAKLTGSEIIDPECEALLAEVEGIFSGLHLGDCGSEPTMDATSNALSKVQALPDGPQKSAITAVLEASMVSQQVG